MKEERFHDSSLRPEAYRWAAVIALPLRLVVGWTTLEDHTVHFRGSDDFQAWRGLVGEFFAAPPQVEHMNTVLSGF